MTKQELEIAIDSQIEAVVRFYDDLMSGKIFTYENPFDFDPIGPESVLDDMLMLYDEVEDEDDDYVVPKINFYDDKFAIQYQINSKGRVIG